MLQENSSRTIRNSSELLFQAPIKPGFVPLVDTMTYATRLRRLLDALFEQRRIAVERDLAYGSGPIERLQTLFNSQWSVSPDDRYLLVTVAFDRSWEVYVQNLVRRAGPTLDLILHHCEGYEDVSCVGPGGVLRYQGFARWVRERQLRTNFYYPTAPDVTVDDITYLRKLAEAREPDAEGAAETFIGTPREERERAEPDRHKREAAAREGLVNLHRLRRLFPETVPDDPTLTVFDLAARNLFEEVDSLPHGETPIDDWIAELKERGTRDAESGGTVSLNARALKDIQGNILTSYVDMTHGLLALVRCDTIDDARRFLTEIRPRLASQHDGVTGTGPFLNLSVTWAGLSRLELDDGVLDRFPPEFKEGMASRNGILGDIGPTNHPTRWRGPEANWPDTLRSNGQRVPLAAVDFVVTVQGRFDEACHDWDGHPLRAQLEELETIGGQILHVQVMQRRPRGDRPEPKQFPREHFGFADGVSQPVPDVKFNVRNKVRRLAREAEPGDRVPLGEILLGHPDARGELRRCADKRVNEDSFPLFTNGSYLVTRKLAQDVAAFHAFAAANAHGDQSAEDVKALIVGRHADGRPLGEHGESYNDFDYDDDSAGRKTPLHAHVRLANPRRDAEKPIPRILRRGFSYGPRYDEDRNAERGLVFMAYNASIAEQFEVVQRWVNGGNVTGIRSGQNDLLTGPLVGSGPHWVRGGNGWRALHPPGQAFVSVEWGLYAFTPSLSAVEWLVDNAGGRDEATRMARLAVAGERIVAQLQGLEQEIPDPARAKEAARDAWRAVIEEPTKGMQAAAVWAYVRREGGKLETPYGLLVGTAELATEVLSDSGQCFSVREYWHRIRDLTGDHYISYDPDPGTLESVERAKNRRYQNQVGDYDAHSEAPNAWIEDRFSGPGALEALQRSRELAQEFLEQSHAGGGAGRVNVEEMAEFVISRLADLWFGIKRDGIPRIRETSQFTFQPYPGDALEHHVRNETPDVPEPLDSAFREHLLAQGVSREEANRAMVGSTIGFAAPGIASIMVILVRWMKSGELAEQAESWCRGHAGTRPQRLMHAIVRTLIGSPVPTLLYRTAMDGATLAGDAVDPGSYVVVGLGSVAIDDRDRALDWLFGGPRDVNPHGCPARGGALAVTVGVLSAVLERRNLRHGGGLELVYGAERTDAGGIDA